MFTLLGGWADDSTQKDPHLLWLRITTWFSASIRNWALIIVGGVCVLRAKTTQCSFSSWAGLYFIYLFILSIFKYSIPSKRTSILCLINCSYFFKAEWEQVLWLRSHSEGSYLLMLLANKLVSARLLNELMRIPSSLCSYWASGYVWFSFICAKFTKLILLICILPCAIETMLWPLSLQLFSAAWQHESIKQLVPLESIKSSVVHAWCPYQTYCSSYWRFWSQRALKIDIFIFQKD